jgi:hypothetical protein
MASFLHYLTTSSAILQVPAMRRAWWQMELDTILPFTMAGFCAKVKGNQTNCFYEVI